jgi:hypothetical protein
MGQPVFFCKMSAFKSTVGNLHHPFRIAVNRKHELIPIKKNYKPRNSSDFEQFKQI